MKKALPRTSTATCRASPAPEITVGGTGARRRGRAGATVDLPPRQRRRRQRRLRQPGRGVRGEQRLGQDELSPARLLARLTRTSERSSLRSCQSRPSHSESTTPRMYRRSGSYVGGAATISVMRARFHHAPRPWRPSASRRADETSCANAIFQQPWWLDAVAPGRWDEATRRARRPRRRAAALRRARSPPSARPHDAAAHADARAVGGALRREAARARSARSTSCSRPSSRRCRRPHAFMQHFSPTMLNALPFHWAGYRLELQYTYRLEGSAPRRRSGTACAEASGARSARPARRVEVRDDLAARPLSRHLGQDVRRQGLPAPVSLAELERLDAACAARGARAMLFATGRRPARVHAVVVRRLGRARRLLPDRRGRSRAAHQRREQPAHVGVDHACPRDHRRLRLRGIDARPWSASSAGSAAARPPTCRSAGLGRTCAPRWRCGQACCGSIRRSG